MPVKRSKSQKKRASDRGDHSKLPAKSSREKKETTQPADKDDSKMPAKRSRRSQKKAQPAYEDDSKMPAKRSQRRRREHSRQTRIIP